MSFILSRAAVQIIFVTVFVLLSVAPREQANAAQCDALFDSSLAYYNANASFYNESRGHESPELIKQRNIFKSLLRPGARILEIGAGHGRDALHFIENGFQVVATEPAAELAKIAEAKIHQKVPLLRAQDIQYRAEFDAIWATASLIHVPPNEMAATFVKLKDALKVGGILLASFLKGVGQPDHPETIPDGRYFNRASERFLRAIVARTPGLRVVESLSGDQQDDYFKKNAPTPTFGFFNLYVVRDY